MRKGLLGDLSSLVKSAKKLQELLLADDAPLSVLEPLDELVLKAFKLVTRAVRFLDIWAQDAVSLSFEKGDSGNNRPLTPPSDSLDLSVQPPQVSNQTLPGPSLANDEAVPVTQTSQKVTRQEADHATRQPSRPFQRLSVAFSLPSDSDILQSPPQPPQPQAHLKRSSLTHRLSYTGKAQGLRKELLVSERLNAAHDSFLGFIGSFIGLHLQSRSSEELSLTTQRSVEDCRKLLAIVEEVWERDSRQCEQLAEARDAMHARLADLVKATQSMFQASHEDAGEDAGVPGSHKQLVSAATSCVRSAGDCVTQTRLVIERIGDFEFEQQAEGFTQTVLSQISHHVQHSPTRSTTSTLDAQKALPSTPAEERKLLPPLITSDVKPLPLAPHDSATSASASNLSNALVSSERAGLISPTSSRTSPPISKQFPTPHLPQPCASEYSQSPVSATQRFFGKAARIDSGNASVADTNSTYRYSVRGDTGSIVSLASTRATTPDHSPVQAAMHPLIENSFGSASELQSMASEEAAAAEEQLLHKSYAHQLIYNKDGQVSGGSLPALVEQLTTHESIPDAVFVTAFFLTFRLFTTPIELAQCLIDRFEYIGDSKHVGGPVRLRVYNVFKGWLETHWQADTDSAALGIIFSFATGALRTSLPAGGKRLAELTSKVTEVRAGALVPRLVSSLGKTGISNTIQFSAGADNVPNPIITKSQLHLLKAWKEGKGRCNILDFEPLELARQFTIIESKLYCSIQPEELLALEWTKKNGSKAVNVRAMSTLSNDLANLVADTILQLEDPKKRATMIKQWVKISMKCLELNNYDSLMTITCSLNSSMVLRLKRTWELVSVKTKARLEELKAITDCSRNSAVLRQRLHNHVAPCIPFVGIYLTDLTFIDAGNGTTRQLPSEPGKDSVSVINFDKHMKTAKIIGQLQSFQVPYRLAAVAEMQEWMEAQIERVRLSDQANVQSYYRRSLLLEPREPHPLPRIVPPLPSDGSATSAGATELRSPKDLFESFNFPFSTGR